MILLALGFVPALIFAWVFELTPEGLKRDAEVKPEESIAPQTARRLDRMIITVMICALVYFGVDKFVLAPRRDAAVLQKNSEEVAAARKQGGAEALVHAYGDKSIAVLPFVNMSTDKDQEYFSDGISEELLNQLAKIHELRVIARTSSFAFKGKDVGVAEIAKVLRVAHVLEGSIRKAGNKIRVTAQLIRTADSSHLWSETYDRDVADIFAVQDEISAAVVAQLKLKLLGAAPVANPVNPQAYGLFLQARQLNRLSTPEGYIEAIALLRQAIEIAPDYAAAWEQLSVAYTRQVNSGLRPIAEGVRLGREAANKAVALAPDFGPAYSALGWIAMVHDGDLATAAQHLTRALEVSPDDNDVLRNAASLARSLGRMDTAIAIGEAEIARDPVDGTGIANMCVAYLFVGRTDDAIAGCRTVLRLSPGFLAAHYLIGVALLAKGEPQAALAEMRQETGTSSWRLIGLPIVWHALGKQAESDAALAELIRKHDKTAAYNIAYVYAYRGEADRAFEWLERAVDNQDGGLSEIVVQPLFANIRNDPRWLPFLRKLGKAPEQLAAIKFDVKLPGVPVAASAHAPADAKP